VSDIVTISDQRSGFRLDDKERILGRRTIQNNRSPTNSWWND